MSLPADYYCNVENVRNTKEPALDQVQKMARDYLKNKARVHHSGQPRRLFISIDCTRDFMDDGRLPVTGAYAAAGRTANLLFQAPYFFDESLIVTEEHPPLTMDSPDWWWNVHENRHPNPREIITYEAMTENVWLPHYEPHLTRVVMQELQKQGNGFIIPWETHCRAKTSGATLVPALAEAIEFHSMALGKNPYYVTKGEGVVPEYSAFGTVVQATPFLVETFQRTHVMEWMMSTAEEWYFTGEAADVCVKQSILDFRDFLIRQVKKPHLIHGIRVIADCMNCVLPGGLEAHQAQLDEWSAQGIQVLTSQEVLERAQRAALTLR